MDCIIASSIVIYARLLGCSMLVEAPPTTRRRKGRFSGVQWKSAEPRAATSLRAIIAKSQSVATNKASVPHV